MRGTSAGIAAFGALMALAPQAQADIDEIHVGVMAHNVCVADCKNANKEDGPNIEFQVSFDSPNFLSWAGSPQPYIVASLNTAGDTSFGGVGLEWRWNFAEGWAVEPSVGYIIHNGATENPYPGGSPENVAFAEHHLLLGSEDLFRTSIGLTRDFAGPWEGQLFFEHMSHGQIIGSGHNQGIDQIGIRIGYQLGGG
ncbi:MAG: acyloxyacyl hydrolase [Hyphomonadaceae bacterium]|nr:acyloxyacyl hydrolase [Hyphomonadaceae bacterium]